MTAEGVDLWLIPSSFTTKSVDNHTLGGPSTNLSTNSSTNPSIEPPSPTSPYTGSTDLKDIRKKLVVNLK